MIFYLNPGQRAKIQLGRPRRTACSRPAQAQVTALGVAWPAAHNHEADPSGVRPVHAQCTARGFECELGAGAAWQGLNDHKVFVESSCKAPHVRPA
jgi:hypothetical protein